MPGGGSRRVQRRSPRPWRTLRPGRDPRSLETDPTYDDWPDPAPRCLPRRAGLPWLAPVPRTDPHPAALAAGLQLGGTVGVRLAVRVAIRLGFGFSFSFS